MLLDPFLLSSPPSTQLFVSSTDTTCATITAHRDGLHLLDLVSLHPLVSHTLPPTTTFPCPAVSKHTIQNGAHIYTTYAAISSPQDDIHSCTVRMWRENVSASLDPSQKSSLDTKSHDVVALYVPDSLSRVMLLSSNARLTVLDGEDLTIRSTRQPADDTARLIKPFFFPPNSRLFSSTGVLVVLVLRVGLKTRVQVLAVEDDEIRELRGCEIEANPDHICAVSCSSSSHISLITRDGTWLAFQLVHTIDTTQASPISDPMHLASLSFILSTKNHDDEISLLALSSSHVLLAGISDRPSPEIILLLWDLQYSVLLASHTMPIPSSFSYSQNTGLKLQLVAASTSQALLVLSPHSRAHSEAPTPSSSPPRSSILVVPFVVPPTSTIANAMGRATEGSQWLARHHHTSTSADQADPTSREKLFYAMRTAMEQNNGKAASEAFFQWEQAEMARLKAFSGKKKDMDSRLILEYELVKRVLGIVLQPSDKATNVAHHHTSSSDVLRHLLSKSAVSSNMLEGGLLPALLLRHDWTSIELAMNHVRDIPEGDMISMLKDVVSTSRTAMEVDGPPLLPTVLSWCVVYRTTPAALRLAIHQRLRDADELVCVLEVIEGWMATLGTRDVDMSSSVPNKKKKSNQQEKTSDPPSLIKMVEFLQVLLDASLVSLVQHTPSHAVLRRIQAHLELEMGFTETMEEVRGHLEVFAKAKVGGRKKSMVGKKEMQERIGIAVGLYRLERLVL